MDRIVWLIVLTVVANFLLECSGVMADTKGIYRSPLVRTYQTERVANAVNPDDVELVDPMQASPTDGRSSRIKLFDNIFKAREIQFPNFFLNFVNECKTCRVLNHFYFVLFCILYLITDSNFNASSGK